jgi:probable S-adenosylmethionine-dependent methyltransferase, YraL family
MSQKSYDGKNALYLIPTPIGNMEDITLRAINILKMVDVIFSEDTRVTNILLKNFEIKKKLIANHKHNEEKNKENLLKYLKDGKNVGLVSDRGTPVISDPGEILSKFAIENGFSVISLPGATALIPALTSSSLDASKFLFYGFLDSKDSKRKKELENIKSIKQTIIFYEAPHRIEKTLNDINTVLGNRKISISREISKKFEEIYRGNVKEIIDDIKNAKGEFVLVLEGNKDVQKFDNLKIIEHVNLYIKEGYSKNEAIKLAAKDRKVSKNIVYKEYNGGN